MFRNVILGAAVLAIAGCSAMGPKFRIHQADARFLDKATVSRTYSEGNLVHAVSFGGPTGAGHMMYLNPLRIVPISGGPMLGFTVEHELYYSMAEAASAMHGPTEIVFIADGRKFTHEARMNYDVLTHKAVGSGLILLPDDQYCRVATAENLVVKVGWMVVENDERNLSFQENLLRFDQCDTPPR